jgi:uncharacterized protein YjbJ (UPF0337 family)
MNSSATNKIKGTAHEAAGKVKEEIGRAVGNPDLQARGNAEKLEKKVGDVKKVFGK